MAQSNRFGDFAHFQEIEKRRRVEESNIASQNQARLNEAIWNERFGNIYRKLNPKIMPILKDFIAALEASGEGKAIQVVREPGLMRWGVGNEKGVLDPFQDVSISVRLHQDALGSKFKRAHFPRQIVISVNSGRLGFCLYQVALKAMSKLSAAVYKETGWLTTGCVLLGTNASDEVEELFNEFMGDVESKLWQTEVRPVGFYGPSHTYLYLGYPSPPPWWKFWKHEVDI